MTKNRITFIGHSSLSIQMDETLILVDPLFSPDILKLYPRQSGIAFNNEEQGFPKTILVTSLLRDHLDIFSFKFFPTDTLVIGPVGILKRIKTMLPNPVLELGHGDKHVVNGIEIESLPGPSVGLGLFGATQTVTNSYLVKSANKTVLVAASPKLMWANVSPVDAACIPVDMKHAPTFGATQDTDLSNFRKTVADIKCQKIIPIHLGSFNFSSDSAPTLSEEDNKRLVRLTPGEGCDF